MDPCECGPEIGGQVNWLFLRREHNSSSPIMQNAGITTLDSRDFDLGSHPGVEASLWMALDSEYRLAGRYFWLGQRTDQVAFPVPAGGGLATNPPELRGAATFDTLSYSAGLQSAEIGLQHATTDYLQLGVGFRYLEFNERLRDSQVDAVGPIGYEQFGTQNDLYGLQATANVALAEFSTLHFNAWGNAGIYANHAESSAVAKLPGLAVPVIARAGDTRNNAAFVGELGLNCVSDLTKNISMVVGYRFLWLEGVALAGDQVARTNNLGIAGTPPRTSTDSNGSAFLHGMSVGIQWQF